MQIDYGKSRTLSGFGYRSWEIVPEYKANIEDEKDLRIVSEYKGTLNASAKVFVGQLSEIQVSITGNPDDYAVEVASNAWFCSLVWPGAVGLVIGGPIGLAAGATVGGIVAYEFERKMWKHVQETVKKVNQVQPTLESVDMCNR